MVADITDVALNIANGSVRRVPAFRSSGKDVKLVAADEVMNRFYLRFTVKDQPGVVAAVSEILAKHQISISSLMQPEGADGDKVPLLIVTYATEEKSMQQALSEIAKLDFVEDKINMFRIEDI